MSIILEAEKKLGLAIEQIREQIEILNLPIMIIIRREPNRLHVETNITDATERRDFLQECLDDSIQRIGNALS